MTNITNPTCLACVLPHEGGVTEVKVSRPCSSQPVLASVFAAVSITAGAELLELMVLVACCSADDHTVVFVSRSSCGHSQRLPEPAVWFQGMLPLWRVILPDHRLPRKHHVYLFLHFILEMPVAVFCSSEMEKKISGRNKICSRCFQFSLCEIEMKRGKK